MSRIIQRSANKRPLSPSSSASPGRSVRWNRTKQQRTFRKEEPIETWQEEDDEDEELFSDEEDEDVGGTSLSGKEGSKQSRVLSLHAPNGCKIAAAFYDERKRVLHVLEDTKDTTGWDLAVLLLEQWAPSMVIMSLNAQDSLIDRVNEYCSQHEIVCELQTSKSFTRDHAISRLTGLQLAGQALLPNDQASRSTGYRSSSSASGPDDASTAGSIDYVDRMAKYRPPPDEYAGMGKVRMSMVKLGSWVNVDVPLAVAATGGLLTYLAKRSADETESYENVEIPVEHIEIMQPEQHMLLNVDALISLNVLKHAEFSPTADKDKDANAIYNLLNFTVTPLGRKLLHTWHIRPLADIDRIRARHDAVEIFNFASNRDASRDIAKSLKQIKNVPIHLKRLRLGRGGHREWRALIDALIAAIQAKEGLMIMPGAGPLDITRKVASMVTLEVIQFQRKAIDIIDFDLSVQEDRPCVRSHVDERLDELFEDYQQMAPILSRVADRIREQLGDPYELELAVQYMSSLGFLVVIDTTHYAFQPPYNWDLTFETDQTQFYRTRETQLLNSEYGDLDSEIQARESEIIQVLIEDLKGIQKEIEHMMDVVSELDCLLALGHAAGVYDLVRPTMVEEPALEIHQGRHLLYESVVGQGRYIMNDTLITGGMLDGEGRNMMVVTGANGSGKSAYGKQVALIAVMAQIGSFVPAKSATIGIVDKGECFVPPIDDSSLSVFTRIQTKESASKTASAFMIDLNQVSMALRGATSRSLIILDEFGKGTTPADGAGLLTGVLEYLLNGAKPRTIVLTHFHELFTNQFLDDDLPIMYCHMKTELAENTKELVYLYRLVPGKSLTSNAAECALAHGLPPKIVDRAREVSELVSKFEVARIHDRPLSAQDVKELKQAEELAKMFLAWDIDETTQDVLDVLRNMIEVIYGGDDDEGEEEAEVHDGDEIQSGAKVEEIDEDAAEHGSARGSRQAQDDGEWQDDQQRHQDQGSEEYRGKLFIDASGSDGSQ